MVDDVNLDERYKVLRQRFVRNLHEWLPTFIKFKDQLQNNTISDFDKILMQMHKLAGSASVFGFVQLNAYAAEIEKHLDQLNHGESQQSVFTALQNLLAAFLIEVNQITAAQNLLQGSNTAQPPKLLTDKKYDYTILVATNNNDEFVTSLLSNGLSKLNINVVQTDNDQTVLEYLQHMQPDLIVFDDSIPGLNAVDLINAIKVHSYWQVIPVLLLTHENEDPEVIKGLANLSIEFITRPFKVTDVVHQILQILKHHSSKILLADDDEFICYLLQQRFYRSGYTVLTAHSGDEALARIQADKPDLAIVDLMMPGMDGLTVLKRVKEDSATCNIPIVLLTAKFEQQYINQCLNAGATEFIIKPFDLDEVADKVSKILSINPP